MNTAIARVPPLAWHNNVPRPSTYDPWISLSDRGQQLANETPQSIYSIDRFPYYSHWLHTRSGEDLANLLYIEIINVNNDAMYLVVLATKCSVTGLAQDCAVISIERTVRTVTTD